MKRFLVIATLCMGTAESGCGGSDTLPAGVEGQSGQGGTPLAGSGGTAGAGQAGVPAAGSAAAGQAASGAGAAGMTAAGAGAQAGAAPAGAGAAAGSAGAAGTGPAAGAAAGSGAPFDGRDPNAVNPYPEYESDIYSSDDMWMCKPGLTHNYCIEGIADATEALPDGSFQPFMDDLRTDHPIDCIFWYPTVNRTEDPNSLDFSDPEPMLASIRSQAARFSRVCNVYAPCYRQTPLNLGGRSYDRSLGFTDVVDSFKHYVANWSEGRSFVVYGHSQGTGHAMRLINQEINDNEDLRGRLVSALMIGGGLSGTSFSNIPLCTEADQFGCAIGFRAYGEPQSLSNIPDDLACTNPADLSGAKSLMQGAFFRSSGTNYQSPLGPDFSANWGLFRDFFTAECVTAPSGGQVLQIAYSEEAGDMREQFLDLSRVIGFGLHVFDYQFPLDDMVELVRAQRDAKLEALQAGMP